MNCQDLNELEGLQFIPVSAEKVPTEKNWQTEIKKYDLSDVAGVGLVCGTPSGNLEAIDFDLKYDITGDLLQRYKKAVQKVDPDLLKLLVVQKTRGGGFHFLYRCKTVAGNTKLAYRYSTEEEKSETYQKSYEYALRNGKSESEAKKEAQAASDNDKQKVLIETRGNKGQVVVAPSKGYEFVYGDLCSIVEITSEQRDILHTIARSFNEVVKEVTIPKSKLPKTKIKGTSPFDDYNQRGDVIALLESHGWKVVSQKGNKTHLLRPGQTTSQTSGNYDHDLGWFSVFSTSTEFEPEHGYRPYAVFSVLECNKDFSEASRRLLDMGYGDKDEAQVKEKTTSTRVIQSRINTEDNDYSFLATGNDYDRYLQQVRNGTLPMGLTTGSTILDEFFMLKEGTMVMINGHDNVGKSVWVWWLLLCAAMYHGWEGNIYSSENSTGNFMRKMIQFYWGKPLYGPFAQTEREFAIAKAFIEKHFHLIRTEETLYNFKDILNMNKKLRPKFPNSKYGMIDPYNSLKTDLSGFSKLSTHDYHYEALSEMKAYGNATNYGWFINHHAVTEALRKTDSDGYPVAPNKADTEGGGKVANKACDFITLHRKTQHPTEWAIMDVHIRKIKDVETGGRQTPLNEPVKFRMYKGQCAYEEVRNDGLPPIDPIARWHQTQAAIKANQPEHKHWADRDDYTTFEQFKEAEERRKNTVVPLRNTEGQVVDQVAKPCFDNYESMEGYVPDDEEARELQELLKKENPF